MNATNLPVNWFDFLIIVMILLGANRGRKNGMSQELIVCLQWIIIVVAAGFLYLPLGDLLATSSPMSHLFCYIACYVGVAMVVKAFFSVVKKSQGGKLIGSDVFGRGEFYLGTVAGSVRFLCILLAAMSLLNARLYTSQEVSASLAFQKDVYGSDFFPELYSVQAGVFKESFCGKYVKQYAGFLLIKPTTPENKGVQRRKDDLP